MFFFGSTLAAFGFYRYNKETKGERVEVITPIYDAKF